jgi:HlyD family secretion protein
MAIMKQLDLNTEVHSPEESHRVLQVIYKRNWIIPMIFGALIFWATWFLLFGKIAITAEGNAILLTPDTLIPFQSIATGQIGKWSVKVGDYVKKGQLLAIVEQPLIEKQLLQARQQLADVQARNRTILSFTDTHLQLAKATIGRKRKMLISRITILNQQIAQSKKLTEANATENIRILNQQRQNLMTMRDLETKRLQELEQELARTERLRAQRLRSADEAIAARQTYSDQILRVLDLDMQLVQFNLTKIKANESELQALNRIKEQEDSVADLTEQQEELTNQETQLDKVKAEATSSMQLQMSELERMVEQLKKQLAENREIRSDYDGRILELTAGEGKVITRGQRLGTIDTGKESRTLEAVAYFKVKDGKRLKPGMALFLTPATVMRERFGSVVARITSVSRFPVSPEGAAKVVGNSNLARTLTQDGHQIEVLAELLKDDATFSGYKWDLTSGPEIELTAGTIASALADIETRSPITFVIPILRYQHDNQGPQASARYQIHARDARYATTTGPAARAGHTRVSLRP